MNIFEFLHLSLSTLCHRAFAPTLLPKIHAPFFTYLTSVNYSYLSSGITFTGNASFSPWVYNSSHRYSQSTTCPLFSVLIIIKTSYFFASEIVFPLEKNSVQMRTLYMLTIMSSDLTHRDAQRFVLHKVLGSNFGGNIKYQSKEFKSYQFFIRTKNISSVLEL